MNKKTVRRYRDHLIWHDGLQWVVQKEYLGTDSKGNAKIHKTPSSYLSSVEAVAKKIACDEFISEFDVFKSTVFEKIKMIIEEE